MVGSEGKKGEREMWKGRKISLGLKNEKAEERNSRAVILRDGLGTSMGSKTVDRDL